MDDEKVVARRPGGRTRRVSTAIEEAVVALLREGGYAALTMDAVAARAQVHRATLYRRWPNRQTLLADVLTSRTEQNIPIPDTGDVQADLELLAAGVVRNLSGVGIAALRAVVAEPGPVGELAAALREATARRLDLVATVVRRGIDRGQLPPDVEPRTFIEELIAPVYFRLLVTGEPVDEEYARERARRQVRASRRVDPTVGKIAGADGVASRDD